MFGNPPPDLGGNDTGGSGGFAVATPYEQGLAAQDTSLVSPAFSLAGIASPQITFNTAYGVFYGQGTSYDVAVDLSLDGGTTWQTVWQQSATNAGEGGQQDLGVTIPVPQAAGKPDVRVRFHFTGNELSFWELDNVLVGTPACAPVAGGLVAGVVTDANTGQPVNGATVASHAQSGGSGTSTATGDPALPGGFYWLFSARRGSARFTAAGTGYAKATTAVQVAADAVTRQDWVLQAGQLSADASSLSATETLGKSRTVKVTFRNGGAAPVRVRFGDQDGGFTPLTQAAHPAAAATAWSPLAGYPIPIVNNAVAYDAQTGQVYSVGGQANGPGSPGGPTGAGPGFGYTASAYVYDPSAQAWDPIAPAPQPLESPAAVFLDGTLYLAGGFDTNADPSAAVYAYTPGSGTWAQVASLPAALAGSAAAVLDGQLYVIGGCTADFCSIGKSQAVYRYDPGSNTWTRLASYPVYGGTAFEACAGIDGELVCAGGLAGSTEGVLNSTYIYNPVSNAWTQGADMPYPDYQMAYAGSGGQLQVAGGVTTDQSATGLVADTSQVSQYNPAGNTWSALPGLRGSAAEWGGGGSCGMYVVGGSGSSAAQVLPGYDRCDGAGDTGWLPVPRAITLKPGQSVTIAVSLNAAKLGQPGTYTASLWAAANTPYPVTVIPVTLQVKPPEGWGLLSGTVANASGKPVAGATVQVATTCTAGDHCGRLSYTLTTAADGTYQWWLPAADNALQVIAAKDGYIQQVTSADIGAGKALTLNYRLQDYQPAMR